MRFQTQLVPARLDRRYKRFLADCTLEESGETITAHCANPGAMTDLATAGTRVWLEPNDDPKRKLKYGWRLVDHENGHFTGVDTGSANRLVAEALDAGLVPPLKAYGTRRAEVRYGEGSRADFLLSEPGLPDAWVEVKSVTLCRDGALAEFPDSVTARGARHLTELGRMAAAGHRAMLIYCVQRTDCTDVTLARDIDPAYAAAWDAARAQGLETIALGTHISPQGITVTGPLG
ncbi:MULTISPECIES: DNA/RNA nuclease SfsA [unclassified Sulfitobacter]|uniref:DNA/RNA nuclease SfsA n=1 Tax=unclassified Sulfitobacter TaxID=196795 RepID=UPI0007C329F1|nr:MULTISPECIES: DNA/RNA nuclease SfsA [unclassified Sulfitobacter]KZY06183.1 sugar fermentation stimulation protein SfsA [Sulfitobacter sp. HI0023]KZY26796.1 sugar fermentation stimulation protein SfsA [Sulfitobacter sp. HI0040]KZZ64105.1 sugar fermentation stimulation protein SfsA [Sulfitobacter sp. HI0129]